MNTRYQIPAWAYKWFYDNVHSRYYNLLMTWCFLPLGGEHSARAALIADIDFPPDEKILDMCCGTGRATFVTAEIAPKSVEITGLDLSAGQIRVARKNNRHSNVSFQVGDATATGFPDGSFHKVIIPHAVHEMYHDLRLKVLAEALRVLKDGGQLIVLELNNPDSLPLRLLVGAWFFYWLPFNFETPTRREMLRIGLTNEVKQAGFHSVEQKLKHRGIFQVVTAVKGPGQEPG